MKSAAVPVRGSLDSTGCVACDEEIHRFAMRCIHCGVRLHPDPIGTVELDRSAVSLRRRAVLAVVLSIVGFMTLLPVLAVPGLVLGLSGREPGTDDARFPARRGYAFVAVVFGALHLVTLGVTFSIVWLRWRV